jgi:hypothetical protein
VNGLISGGTYHFSSSALGIVLVILGFLVAHRCDHAAFEGNLNTNAALQLPVVATSIHASHVVVCLLLAATILRCVAHAGNLYRVSSVIYFHLVEVRWIAVRSITLRYSSYDRLFYAVRICLSMAVCRACVHSFNHGTYFGEAHEAFFLFLGISAFCVRLISCNGFHIAFNKKSSTKKKGKKSNKNTKKSLISYHLTLYNVPLSFSFIVVLLLFLVQLPVVATSINASHVVVCLLLASTILQCVAHAGNLYRVSSVIYFHLGEVRWIVIYFHLNNINPCD